MKATIRVLIVMTAAAVLVSGPAWAQPFYLQEVDAIGGIYVPITILSIPFGLTGQTGVAEFEMTGTPPVEIVFHDLATIHWIDLNTLTPIPFPPLPGGAPIHGLGGVQVVNSGPALELVALSNTAGTSFLYAYDFDLVPPQWVGPFAIGFLATSMTTVDVVSSLDADLVFSDGTNVLALDATVTGQWTVLPAPGGAIDSLAAADVGNGVPPTASTRQLSANIGKISRYFDKVAFTWSTNAATQHFRIANAAPVNLNPAVTPPVGAVLVPAPAVPTVLQFLDAAPAIGGFAPTTTPGGDGHCPGAVFAEINGDAWPDMYLSRGIAAAGSSANQLFFGRAGGTFNQQTTLGALDTGNGSGALALDYDNDGRRDLYALNFGGDNRLYRQTAAGTFIDVTAATDPSPADPPNDTDEGLRVGLPDPVNGHCPPLPTSPLTSAAGPVKAEEEPLPDQDMPQCVIDDTLTAAAGDFNRDGLIDIYVGNHLCCNFPEGERDILYIQDAGGGTFTDLTFSAGLTKPTLQHSSTQSVIVADFNNDAWPDIYVTIKINGPGTRDWLFLNDGPGFTGAWSGTFTEWFASQPQSALGSITAAAMGIDVADFDNDGDLDIFLTDLQDTSTAMDFYRNMTVENNGVFGLQIVSPNPMAAPYWSWGVAWADFDNDRDPDLHMSTNAGLFDWFFRNDGGGAFTEIAYEAGLTLPSDSRGNVPADYDRDGRLDLLVVERAQPIKLFRNQTANANGWLGLRLVGNPTLAPMPYLSTRDAVGARIDVTAGGVSQRRDILIGGITCGSTRDLVAYFGLGTATGVSAVRIQWPSGRTTTLPSPIPMNQVLTITE